MVARFIISWLCIVRNFMRDYARKLRLVIGSFKQATLDEEVSAG